MKLNKLMKSKIIQEDIKYLLFFYLSKLLKQNYSKPRQFIKTN